MSGLASVDEGSRGGLADRKATERRRPLMCETSETLQRKMASSSCSSSFRMHLRWPRRAAHVVIAASRHDRGHDFEEGLGDEMDRRDPAE